MPRAAGPLYVVVSYDQAATAEWEVSVFYIGNLTDNLWLTNNLYVARAWDTELVFTNASGQGKVMGLPSPPSSHVFEMWSAAGGSGFVGHTGENWYAAPIPDTNPAATSHLFLGHKPQDGNAAWRGEGTIRRMAVYDHVPNEAERGQLVAWVSA